MANILLLLDMQTLWDNCREQYGKRARVDFKGLLDKVKNKKTDKVRAVAFVANRPEKNQDNLIKKLNDFGIETVTKQVGELEIADFTPDMLTVLSEAAGIDLVAVGGGNTTLIPVLEAANNADQTTLLLGFCVGVKKETACVADDIKLLQKSDTITQ
jgi:hypothetical protein